MTEGKTTTSKKKTNPAAETAAPEMDATPITTEQEPGAERETPVSATDGGSGQEGQAEADTTPGEPTATTPTDVPDVPPEPGDEQVTTEDALEGDGEVLDVVITCVLHVTKPLMRGDDVRRVQEELIKRKFGCGPEGASGVYGAQTAHAVRMFQAMHRLRVTGRVDEYTARALGLYWADVDDATLAELEKMEPVEK